MRIAYSRGDSDMIAKMKGTYQERPKKMMMDKRGKGKKGKVSDHKFFIHGENSLLTGDYFLIFQKKKS